MTAVSSPWTRSLERLLTRCDDVSWSVSVLDVGTGAVVGEHDPHQMLPTASVAKVHLLVEVAARFVVGTSDPSQLLDRREVSMVSDSGLWQHLSTDLLPAIDVARLVGAVSDNLATNVLLEVVGLDAVHRRGQNLAPDGSRLHDIVRDTRGPADPPTLSQGTASDWATLFASLSVGSVVDRQVSRLVLDWLRLGPDLSMVASAFGLDPLAHGTAPDRGIRLWNKTGTDAGVRCDVGLVEARRVVAYAALAHWDPPRADRRDDVLNVMRAIGALVRAEVTEVGSRFR